MKKLTYIFPGQGSQVYGMGKSFYENSQITRDIFSKVSDKLDIDFAQLLFAKEDASKEDVAKLAQTQFTQPAILLVSSIAHMLFQEKYKLKANFALGHSLGEFSALVASGALDIVDAVYLVHKRGLFMKEACDKLQSSGIGEAGMMVVLGLEDKVLEELCANLRDKNKKIWCANYNNDGQVVLAGIKEDLEESVSVFKENKAKRAMLLNMSVASHCPLLETASKQLEELLNQFIAKDCDFPIISNVTSQPYSTKSQAIKLLTLQLQKPVLYKQSILNVAENTDAFIEFGHSNVLKGLNKKLTTTPTHSIDSYESLQSFAL